MDAHQPQQQAKRRRQFRREPVVVHAIDIGKRDLDMIGAIAKNRLMNSEQLVALFACDCPRIEKLGVRAGKQAMIRVKQHRPGCSCTCGVGNSKRDHSVGCLGLLKDDQHVAARLRELFQAGYLERPIIQLQLRVQNGVRAKGSVPMVYAASKAGIAVIGDARRETIGLGKLSWVGKINEEKRPFLEHTLAVADVSVAVDVGVRRRPDLVRATDAMLQSKMSAKRRVSPRPWSLQVEYKGTKLSAVCDLAFAIGDTSSGKRFNFLVEVDRGHMPVVRKSLSATSIMRKLIAYSKAHDAGEFEAAFGWHGQRVLILTTSDARVRSCIEATQAMDSLRRKAGLAAVGHLFLFATQAATRDLFGAVYQDGDGRPVSLLG